MGYLKKYKTFSINENKEEHDSIRDIVKSVNWVRKIANKVNGVYTPFEFVNETIGYEVERKIIDELLDTSIFDILKIHLSKVSKEGNKYTDKFTDLVKDRLDIDLYDNIEYLLKNLTLDNIKLSENKDEEEDRLKELVGFIKSYNSILEKLDGGKIGDSTLLRELRKLGEMVRKLQDVDNGGEEIKESKHYEGVGGFDVDFAISKIKENYTLEQIKADLEKEITNWADENDYVENGNGEAEEIIIENIISWYEGKYDVLEDNELSKLQKEIQKNYDILNF